MVRMTALRALTQTGVGCRAPWLSSGHGTNSHRCYRRDPI